MHSIQLDILERITLCPLARYSDLKSNDIDGNQFMYHLNQLMDDGYIQKNNEKKYFLTQSGKSYISLLSTKSGEMRKQPQILVMLYCRNQLGQLLLFKWSREPNNNLVSLPHGKLHFGISPEKMAKLELKEKCNLEGEMAYRGDMYLKIWSGKEIFNHILCHIYEVSKIVGGVASNTKNGSSFWGSIDDFSEVELWPGTWEILDTIDPNPDKPFFTEAEVSL
jgi:predicted transcriptional regulator